MKGGMYVGGGGGVIVTATCYSICRYLGMIVNC